MKEQKLCSSCGQQEPCGCVVSTLNAVVNEVIDLTFELKAQWKRTYEFHESIGKRMLTLEGAYKADAEVARDIIFEGARRSEEIRQIKSENDTHCGAISALESKVKKIEDKFKDIHDWERVMSEGVSSLVVRLDKLEGHYYSDGDLSAIHGQLDNIHKNDKFTDNEINNLLIRIKTIEDFIGQNYNANLGNIRERILEVQGVCIHNNGVLCEDITAFEKRLGEAEECIKRITEDDMKAGRKPYKCPVCDSEGYVKGISNNIAWGHRCYTCEGKGIVWG